MIAVQVLCLLVPLSFSFTANLTPLSKKEESVYIFIKKCIMVSSFLHWYTTQGIQLAILSQNWFLYLQTLPAYQHISFKAILLLSKNKFTEIICIYMKL